MKRVSHIAVFATIAATLATGPAFAADTSLALVLGVKGSPFYEAMACGAKAKAAELGIDLTVSASDQWGPDQQIPIVNAIAAAKPTAAAIVPVDAQALIAPMKQLDSLGIHVLTADQTINDDSFVKTRIVTDNKEGGKRAAIAMNELLAGKGKVVVMTNPPGTTAQDERTAGFEAEIKGYPGITYLGQQFYTNPQQATEMITAILAKDPDVAGIFVTNDLGAIGAVTGLRQANAGAVKVVAYDAAGPEVSALKNGQIHALIAQDPRREGELAVETAAALAAGKPVEKTTFTEIVTIKASEPEMADKYEYKAGC
ncbi:ABC transporter substrate-binding protein [Kaistia dalseonensis]|uniref:Ribose transport system substrate-binding protein n=1 Tax=Kaistia dalseonensis TaxID=410840 RepID=A0ABU0H504_9HYPH|nr:ABC transporter substrate-binding protein [Kaistia dalseonensis]MCX5494012.1 ABC transporter substrate-binding protein [Kaistia dalseonensis]MDQ0436589.1 ribose transport system substrate-binding protein [Kaistia dalseonensis]